MKRNMILGTVLTAGAAGLLYFFKRNRAGRKTMDGSPETTEEVHDYPPQRHLTDAFAKAKKSHS